MQQRTSSENIDSTYDAMRNFWGSRWSTTKFEEEYETNLYPEGTKTSKLSWSNFLAPSWSSKPDAPMVALSCLLTPLDRIFL